MDIKRSCLQPSGKDEFSPSITGNTSEEEVLPHSGTKRILVAYFSHSGNTREIANQIHKSVGGDIFEIQGWCRNSGKGCENRAKQSI